MVHVCARVFTCIHMHARVLAQTPAPDDGPGASWQADAPHSQIE